MANKPSIPKGTRDFSPQEMLRRKYIFNTIEKVFQKYGYLPLETPAMENLETLTGKYGEEGDRLIFKVLNSGDFYRNFDLDELSDEIVNYFGGKERDDEIEFEPEVQHDIQGKIRDYIKAKYFTEKALRYDLTVPFARYVVQHQNEITFPFKRYQIQPVWRADRPQKGRYREFYQCDADVIGSTSLLNEVELLAVIDEVFTALDLDVQVLVNNRKILAGIAERIGHADKLSDVAIVLDKVDKVDTKALSIEALGRGISEAGWNEVMELRARLAPYRYSHGEVVQELRSFMQGSEIGLRGVEELGVLVRWFNDEKMSGSGKMKLAVDVGLARGLDYYTGAIFEVKAAEGSMPGSICGGGRYDDLTGIFGLKNMSGVGISFGADRIYDVLLETNKFPAELGSSTQLLFANFGEAEAMHCLKLLRAVREAGIASELYPDTVKLPKQFTYAEKKGIPYVAIVGESEMKDGKVTLKKMGANEKGDLMTIEELINKLNG
ncbi:MAG: histidine--tRNA ligase [Flavobacteriales bacterium]|nr:histidine--tRNA ligase [Flavobacteriales bacterium]